MICVQRLPRAGAKSLKDFDPNSSKEFATRNILALTSQKGASLT